MMPKTWREVEIEKAWCEGWMKLADEVEEYSPAFLDDVEYLTMKYRLAELSALRPCEECKGSGMDYESDKSFDHCSACHGTGMAKEG
jgi:hypothetical protein